MQNLDELTDRQLITNLHAVHAKENGVLVEFLVVLGACDRRKVFGAMHEAGTYKYLVERMRLSEDQAYRRVQVARVAREFPTVLGMLERGEITLTNVELLKLYLTKDNHEEVLREAAGKTKSQVKELIAKRFLPEGMTPREKMSFFAAKELKERIAYATSLMRHANPSGDLSVVIERAVDLLIVQLEKQLKKGKTRREVFERDGIGCVHVDEDGVVCGSTDFLELDHLDPKAKGGSDEPTNKRPHCRLHNYDAAVRVFGREHMDKKVPRRRDADLMWMNVAKALAEMGFRDKEAKQAVAVVRARHPEAATPPIAEVIKQSLAVLT